MIDRIKDLWWAAARDMRDYRIKWNRLQTYGSIYSHTPEKYDIYPLAHEESLLDTWKYVFATLFETDMKNVTFSGTVRFDKYELWVNRSKVCEATFPEYSVEAE